MSTFASLSTKERAARLGLHQVQGIGAQLASRLLREFGEATEVFDASERALRAQKGLGEALVTRLLAGFDQQLVMHQLDAIERLELQVLCVDDPLYPDGYKRLKNPPYILFCQGRWPASTAPERFVSLVGTRRPDHRGVQLTREAAASLVQSGYTVVSGGALGIDTAAHATALAHQGSTIAVLAHGLDSAYPSQNRSLFQQIREQGGALLSEFGPGVRPEKGYFPRRNRLIAGLCAAVVVVQCGAQSGALNTADHAMRADIPVMTYPGRPQEPLAAGPHKLLRKGALLVESGREIIAQLNDGETSGDIQLTLWDTSAQTQTNSVPQKKNNSHVVTIEAPCHDTTPLTIDLASLDPPSQTVLAQLEANTPKHIDEVIRLTAMPVSKVTTCLLQLELEGWVQAHPGMHFTRL